MADVTPPLDDFLREYEADNNTWWRTDCGHHMNLFEAAVDRMRRAERLLSRLVIPSEVFVVPETSEGVAAADLQSELDRLERPYERVLGEDELYD
jgi:hypothetical protein